MGEVFHFEYAANVTLQRSFDDQAKPLVDGQFNVVGHTFEPDKCKLATRQPMPRKVGGVEKLNGGWRGWTAHPSRAVQEFVG